MRERGRFECKQMSARPKVNQEHRIFRALRAHLRPLGRPLVQEPLAQPLYTGTTGLPEPLLRERRMGTEARGGRVVQCTTTSTALVASSTAKNSRFSS